jgi:outer membrane protein OmpA-like peptidoglycan-associated protein
MNRFFSIGLTTLFFLKGLLAYSSENSTVQDSSKYASEKPKSLLTKARKAADNDDYAEAKEIYLYLLQKDSTNPLYNYECGLNYFLNLFEQPLSLPFFERTLKYSGKDTIVKVYYYLGQAYQLNNRYDEAAAAYTNYTRFIKKNKTELQDVKLKIDQCKQGNTYLATFNNVVNIDNLGNSINTSEAEYVPVVKGDESVMYFTARRKSNVGGEKDLETNRYYEDMFISKGDSGVFSIGTRFTIGDSLTKRLKNTGANEAVVSLSYDEKYLISYKNNSLWYSEWINGGWSKPIRFSKNINVGEYQNHGSYSANNDTLYFSSNTAGGFGGMDIYYSVKAPSGKWGKAQNLGAAINTQEDEDSPTISYDNVTLYFSSKGHSSMGGYDVFKSVFADGKWSEPINLGMPINSSGDDIYFKYDKYKKQAYFSSSRQNGFGDYDIYRLIDYNTPRFENCELIKSLKGFPIVLEAKKELVPKLTNSIYHWEFQDGSHAEGASVTHEFKETGEQLVRLYEVDSLNQKILQKKDCSISVNNTNTEQFNTGELLSVDSLLLFNGAPLFLNKSSILKYHWSFGDSTLGGDSSSAKHRYKYPGTYEIKLSMVARNDSTEEVFQKCISRVVTILGKEEFKKQNLASLSAEQLKSKLRADLLEIGKNGFFAPDTTTIEIENSFDASMVYIPKSTILRYEWNFGDFIPMIAAKQVNHTYDSIGVYKVKMNVIYQVDSTMGIYETNLTKDVVVVSQAEYDSLNQKRIARNETKKSFETDILNKPKLDFLIPDTTSLGILTIFESKLITIPNAKVLKFNWTFGDSTFQKDLQKTTHAYKRVGNYDVTLNVVYQNNETRAIYESDITKRIVVIDSVEYSLYDSLKKERIAKNEIKKSLETEMLNKPKLDLLIPDTTSLGILTIFESKLLTLSNAKILKYNWSFGDSTYQKDLRKTTHAYKRSGKYDVTLNVVYQNNDTKAIYESDLTKRIVVIEPEAYALVKEARRNRNKKDNTTFQEYKILAQFDTANLPSIALENIYFDYDKFNIRPDAKEALLRNIQVLSVDTLLAIKVSANTDSRGSKAYNFKLSAKRAISAINFLAENNIARSRIIAVVSKGETNLVNKCGDNVKCTEAEHQLNRRDEFDVVGRVKK